MSYKLEISPAAMAELRDASVWYEQQRPELGLDFLVCAEEAIDIIRRNPEAYQKIVSHVRCKRMERFPYGIFFRLRNAHIEIIAVLHNSRDPVSWRKRL